MAKANELSLYILYDLYVVLYTFSAAGVTTQTRLLHNG